MNSVIEALEEQDEAVSLLGADMVIELMEASRYVAARAAFEHDRFDVASDQFSLLRDTTRSSGRRLKYRRWLERLAFLR